MIKKNLNKIGILSLCLVLGASSTAFAKSSETSKDPNTPAAASQNKDKRVHRGEGFSKLLEQLGLSKEDVSKARESGKTLFDLAKEKGYTKEQVKSMLIKNETESINKAVSEGKLTRDEGDKFIKNMEQKLANWDGTFMPHGRHNPMWLANIKELGLTEQDIDNARKSGKSIFDLTKEKKGLSAEQTRQIIIKAKTESINKKVTEGKITKEKASEIIANMKSKIEKWDGR